MTGFRKDRLLQEQQHDPYFVKTEKPAVCSQCGVIFDEGTFMWRHTVHHAHPIQNTMICPACRRIADHYEGGIVELEGDFLTEHQTEILNLITHIEQQEKNQRPLERIIQYNITPNRIELTTTYEHLSRRIGEAIHRSYKGELRLDYPDACKYVRVYWRR